MSVRFFGVDGEMTGSELAQGQRIIQLGFAVDSNVDRVRHDVPPSFSLLFNPGPAVWTDVAEAVHGFTRDEVAAAMPAADADVLFVEWLEAQGARANKRGDTIPVGFNVGNFDLPHIQAVLPRTYSMLSRRTVDLNAVCFTFDGAVHPTIGSPVSWSTWKSMASEYARKMIDLQGTHDGAAHDAGYDALLHLHAFRYLQSASRGAVPVMPEFDLPVPDARRFAAALIAAHGVDYAAHVSGVPEVFLQQWARGGRATNETYIAALKTAYEELEAV